MFMEIGEHLTSIGIGYADYLRVLLLRSVKREIKKRLILPRRFQAPSLPLWMVRIYLLSIYLKA